MLALLKPYKGVIFLMILLALLGNGVNLLIPKIISHAIDSFHDGTYSFRVITLEFLTATVVIFIFTYLQSIVQTLSSERAARDLRTRLSEKISRQDYSYIRKANPSRLLTNLTSDIDSVKMFISLAVPSIASSVFIILGASVLLLTINWKLAVPVLLIIPLMALTFGVILRKVRVLFKRSREVIDRLNKVINETIMGSAIIRVINSQQPEYQKFLVVNARAKSLGISILTLFATLIPVITFIANLATLVILALGGHFVMTGALSLGDFAAFNSYLALLIFPIILIGFMSNVIAQASASYERIDQVIQTPEVPHPGTLKAGLTGAIDIREVCLSYGDKPVLKNVTLSITPGSRTAILGPTAAGKSQLLYLLMGLINPDSGRIEYDGKTVDRYDLESFHSQVGFVFQDSVMFNLSLRENIAFKSKVSGQSLARALETSELTEFIKTLPEKLDTLVSERGTSLSGGQKQRIMLARALAIDPKILILDDFTARVDKQTEEKILNNIIRNYPEVTLISVTQKISPVMNFDRIILVMEGEVLASGRHEDLMDFSPEYVQIFNSQRSTSHYEL